MEKTEFVLESIKAIKGHVKAKNQKLKFYSENSDRIEALKWDYIRAYNFEFEILELSKNIRTAEKIFNGKYSAKYVKKLLSKG
jgi:hypothetical protein